MNSISNNANNILLGHTGQDIEPYKPFTDQIIALKPHWSRSYLYNQLLNYIQDDWICWLEPSEIFLEGNFPDLKPAAYGVNLLQNDFILKPCRLWHQSCNLQYINPIFEKLNTRYSLLPLYFSSLKVKEDKLPIIKKWRQQEAFNINTIYYEAFAYLELRQYHLFCPLAEKYCFLASPESPARLITLYYLAIYYLYIKKNTDLALKNIKKCLMELPFLAEYWCLLGDIMFYLKQYKKAYAFFQNAIWFGSQRLDDDLLPMQISKYQAYPQEMMEKCQLALDLKL